VRAATRSWNRCSGANSRF